jgi:hypothetical protein
MVGSYPDVSRTSPHHAQKRTKNATHSSHLSAFAVFCCGESIKMPEELISPINQVHFHNFTLSGAPDLEELTTLNRSGFGAKLCPRFECKIPGFQCNNQHSNPGKGLKTKKRDSGDGVQRDSCRDLASRPLGSLVMTIRDRSEKYSLHGLVRKAILIESMEITVEETGLEVLDLRTDIAFATRDLHTRDIGGQMAGLQRLSRALLEKPDTILQELVSAAVDLCGADSAGISIEIEDGSDQEFYHWIATAGDYSGFLDAILPRSPSACGLCLERGHPQHFTVSKKF